MAKGGAGVMLRELSKSKLRAIGSGFDAASRRRGVAVIECAEEPVTRVEQVVDQTVDLHVFGDAVGRAQVDRGVAGKRRVVVAFIAEEILVAGGNDVGAKLPLLQLYNVGAACR